MRMSKFIALLVLLTLPVPLFAQGGGTGAGSTATTQTSRTGTSSSAASVSVENMSEQGGFIGSGVPSGFVGTEDIYTRTSNSARSARSTASSSRIATTTRPRTTGSATQRAAGAARPFSSTGSLRQSVSAATVFDSDISGDSISMQRPQPAVETGLNRIQGIQDSRIAFTDSPTGTTAVLTGTVATDRERRVAQLYLLMEPGVNRVENLLEVR